MEWWSGGVWGACRLGAGKEQKNEHRNIGRTEFGYGELRSPQVKIVVAAGVADGVGWPLAESRDRESSIQNPASSIQHPEPPITFHVLSITRRPQVLPQSLRQDSRITHHASRITHHASRITHHASRIPAPTAEPYTTWSSGCGAR